MSQDPETIQRGYGILNLSAGIRAEDGHYELAAFVNNAFNKHYYANLYNSRGTYNNQTATQALIPRDFRRYFGVRGSYSF